MATDALTMASRETAYDYEATYNKAITALYKQSKASMRATQKQLRSRVDEHIKTDKVPYDVWIEKGLVTVTETLGGIKTDYKYIIKYLEDLVKEYDLKPQLICYDPHNASAFLSDLETQDFAQHIRTLK